ncbi:MAG: two pore domain potassium channel family protein, partial [Acidimicrobiia bacterium]|nr:two pore domain potassium channel family protein [Acidimicrobiia bacterium]
EVAILRHVFRMPVVNVGVVIGSLCMYVMLGIMFANLYLVVQAVSGQDFFVTGRGTQSDFLYFSFVTETTTGYGDYTAAGKLGRTLAITEAMIGQILLVTLVARFVGSFGTRRPVRDDRGDDTDPPGAAPAEPVGD